MEAYACFVFTLCVLLAGKASATECGTFINTTTNSSGDISQPTTAKTPCEINITTTVNVFIQVRNLVLQGKDTLEIFDVYNTSYKAPIAMFKNGDVAPFPVVTGLQNNITIIFTPGVNSTSNWNLGYNTACTVNIASDWSHKVDSPKYLPSLGKLFKCQYTITCNLPLDRLAALSFLSLSVFNNSRLNLTSGSNNATLTNTSVGEDFFADNTQPIILSFDVNATRAQNFSVFVEPVVKDCSGNVNIHNTPQVQKTFSNPELSYVCRWIVTSTLSRITARINSLQITGGYDSMTFTEGGSSKAAVNKTLSSASNDWLFLSVGQKAVISLQLGEYASVRSLNLSLLESDAGGPLFGQGQLSVDDKQGDNVTYYQLYANAGQLVKVVITERKLNESTVVFYNGLQPTDPVLLSLNANGPNLTTVIVASPALVAVTRDVKTPVFKATFSSLDPGCDQLATGSSGSWNYKDTTGPCHYTVVPQTGQVILYLDSFTLRSGDSLKVFSGVDSMTVIAQFMLQAAEVLKDFNLRQVYGEAGQGISVVLTRNTTVKSQSETAIRHQVVNKVCGGDLQNNGDINTPNYPNEYPINAKCLWTIKDAKPNEMLLLNFISLQLAKKHSLVVTDKDKEVARFEGDTLPTADLLINATNSIKIEFSSPTDGEESQVGLGVKVEYQRPNCGASLTKFSDVIVLPSGAGSLCVWTINVKNETDKSNSTNIVKFNISNLNITVLKESLTVYDGGSLRDNVLEVFLNQTNYSLRNILVFKWHLIQNLTEKVNISYQTKTCGSTELCQNGLCMRPEWLCNRKNDCGDNTDELNCSSTPPPPVSTTTQKPQEADYSGWVKSGWVPACLIIGILLGLVLYFVVPKVYRRIRGRGGNYSRMADDRPVVT